MSKNSRKKEERKVRSSDFAMYQTAESRPTGLHHIFDAFRQDAENLNTEQSSSSARSDDAAMSGQNEHYAILRALDKLTKKDTTTKLKAIDQLLAALETVTIDVLEKLMPDFIHVFLRLAIVEPARKIRLHLGHVLSKMASILKKRMQLYMDNLITHWWVAIHDEASDVAEVYNEAFSNLFASTGTTGDDIDIKTFRVLTHYIERIVKKSLSMLKKDVAEYKKDWLDVFGRVCDNCATISDMHNRLMCSVMRALMKIMIYQRVHTAESVRNTTFVSVFINTEFVELVGYLCGTGAIKQRYASTCFLVEFVKVLQPEHLETAKKVFSIAKQRLSGTEDPKITFHLVRMLCACSRYNSACWDEESLKNYVSFVQSILENYKGDFALHAEFYSVFPCMVSYLPPEWLQSPVGFDAVFQVTTTLLKLMQEKLDNDYEKSFGFDVKEFSQMGSSMLYCYYRILLLLHCSCEDLVEHIFAPILKLNGGNTPHEQHFLSHMPRIFTEFIEESVVLRTPGAYEVLLHKLQEIYGNNTNYVLMAQIFNSLANVNDSVDQHEMIRTFAQGVQQQLKHHIMDKVLPELLQGYVVSPSDDKLQLRIDIILGLLAETEVIGQDSALLGVTRTMINHSYTDTKEFNKAFQTLKKVLEKLPSVLEDPELYYTESYDEKCILLVSLVALQNCESNEQAVRIVNKVCSKQMQLDEETAMMVFLPFINECQRFAPVLSDNMLLWLSNPTHFSEVLFEPVFNLVDPEHVNKERRMLYDMFYAMQVIFIKHPTRKWHIGSTNMVNDLVSLYLVGYYTNIWFTLDTFYEFIQNLLPQWQEARNALETSVIREFLQHIQQRMPRNEDFVTRRYENFDVKDLVYAMMEIQRDPCKCTESIARTLATLESHNNLDIANIYHRNAVLFSTLWLENCETILYPFLATGNQNTDTQHSDVDTEKDILSLKKYFMDVYVSTLIHSGFTVSAFGELCKKLGGNQDFSYIFAVSFVNCITQFNFTSKALLEEKIRILKIYTSQGNTMDIYKMLKKHYMNNPFMGGFISALDVNPEEYVKRIDSVTNMIMESTDSDAVVLTNCLFELGYLLDCVCSGESEIQIVEYSARMESLCHLVDRKLTQLTPNYPSITCWMHYAAMYFWKTCVVINKVAPIESLTMWINTWSMEVTHMCYQEMYKGNQLAITLFANMVIFETSQALLDLQELRQRPNPNEFSKENLDEYIQVIGALLHEKRGGTSDNISQRLDTHYLLVMLVEAIHIVESYRDSECTMDLVGTLKDATYGFLQYISSSDVCYIYATSFISQLWHVKFLLSGIAKHGGVLCNVNLDRNAIHLNIPSGVVSKCFEELCTHLDKKQNVTIDMAKLMFELSQDFEKEYTDDEPEELPSPLTYETSVRRGRSVISFCLNLILGPYITKIVYKTYEVLLESSEHQDLELCLTTWMSIFVMLHEMTEAKMLALKNVVMKLFKTRPLDAGGEMYNTLVAYLATQHDTTTECIDAWWVKENRDIPEYTDEPILHVLLQVLMLCLGNLPVKAEQNMNLVKELFYRMAKTFPEEVNQVWNVCKSSYIKKQIREFTKAEITQKLIADELRMAKYDTSTTIRITHDADYRNVSASLDTKAEVSINLAVKIPSAFPLEPLSFVSSDEAGTFKNKHLRWLMMAQSTANREGLFQGLLLWSDNITKFFDGIEECPICYSIVHLQFNTIPGKVCKVCKHKFHTECLYKWFRNAPKAKCPLCQSLLSFNTSS
ncbi:FANCL C-terminal domain family protein [Babesia bovis T2Bo]|uniref:E3 ubiquitin-protein ligase listerin n=1 Tax=Babesia bovis TaxID=5865 RepID=A7AX63_BABBO|nr:FANCL C-terminal domain family protein [Babesia bovis T2Bo]EDO05136.1 FANCL C-terminal domain family protein [Babesia bovis T2Bo]|eukprot:XP_001608704.1 hypothetical protein [Babesia bovis T2Bo]